MSLITRVYLLLLGDAEWGTEEPAASAGRANQKLRTRNAIVEAAVDLMRAVQDITMLEVAKAALVSEATAYRYFPT